MIFGIVVFSSLTFISVVEFNNYVFWRHILAASICRLILTVGLTGLRAVQRKCEQQAIGGNDLVITSKVK